MMTPAARKGRAPAPRRRRRPPEPGTAATGQGVMVVAARARRAVERLRRDALALEQEFSGVIAQTFPRLRASVRNLLHYLAVRQHDIRSLQNDLGTLGVSSLGRMEAHTLASLDTVLDVLQSLCGKPLHDKVPGASPCTMEQGDAALKRHADAILGPSPADRRARIMVTMPGEVASDAAYIRQLLLQGMNIMRINCAHDGPAEWKQMVQNLRAAEKDLGRACLISFDLAGPKLRTGPIQPGLSVARWRPAKNRLGQVVAPARVRFCSAPMEGDSGETVIMVTGQLTTRARVGDRIALVDARGRDRVLRVVEAGGTYCVCEARETAYVIPRTRLALRRDKRIIARAAVDEMPAVSEVIRLRPGDILEIVRGDVLGRPAVLDDTGRTVESAVVGCSLPEVFQNVRAGHRIFLDDGRIAGVVRSATPDRLRVEISSAVGGTAKLRDEKGINLPDTDLRLPALTSKDRADLEFVAKYGDMVALSFVQRPEDIDDLMAELQRHKVPRLGIMLKIETRQAFSRLPALLISAMRRPLVAVMVARGDLGVEVGFERLSEVQEEILWLSEAAHLPVVWATQVLESLAKGGTPSRAEVTDAAMGSRAECVMLNKGPYILKTMKVLCDVLTRMESHQSKKTPLLRKLKVSDLVQARRSATSATARPATGGRGKALKR